VSLAAAGRSAGGRRAAHGQRGLRTGPRIALRVALRVALLATAAAPSQVASQAAPPPPPAAAVPTTPALAASAADAAPLPCRLHDLPHAALCGTVRRPLDPARPLGVQIDVHYAVVPALARRKAADAVVFFAGGPGQSAIDLAGALAARYARLAQRRDLVFVDLRGTGRSAPLRCADDDERAGLQPLADALDETRRHQRLAACRVALQALPYGDLRFFTTSSAMADVDAVRRALGLAQINAVGASYGTRAVLDYLRLFPGVVRRAVLDGVAPPDMRLPDAAARDNQAVLDALLQACASTPACQRQHPDLRGQWQAVLNRLPQDVLLPHPLTGRPQAVRLQRETVLGMVRAPLYLPALAAALPAVVGEAAAGRWAPLAALAGAVGGGAGSLATGLHFSVVCAEDLGVNAPASELTFPVAATAATPPTAAAGVSPGAVPANDFGASFATLYRQACADWPRGQVDPAFYTVSASATPVWLLSGGLDPVTPPRHGQRVTQALGPMARHGVVAHAGHGVTGLGCVRDAVVRFITADDDAAALTLADAGLSCAAAVPRPPAFVPPGWAQTVPPAPPAPPAPSAPPAPPALLSPAAAAAASAPRQGAAR
jgi:pimeloyl-ACP methyl ester carboxylesterase